MKENLKLAEMFNKLYSHIKAGGDFSFSSDSKELLEAKRFIEESHGKLNIGVLGFLVELVRKHSDCDFEFVPSKNGEGVELRYSFKVDERVQFNKDGFIVNKQGEGNEIVPER